MGARTGVGLVYVIHLNEPLIRGDGRKAWHYVGWAGDLNLRLNKHAAGGGSAFLAECVRRGITWRLGTVFRGGADFEALIKKNRNHSQYCGCCAGKHAGTNTLSVEELRELLNPKFHDMIYCAEDKSVI